MLSLIKAPVRSTAIFVGPLDLEPEPFDKISLLHSHLKVIRLILLFPLGWGRGIGSKSTRCEVAEDARMEPVLMARL